MAIVGIDLGTTNSLVAYLSADGPVTIPNELGDHLTPSVVAFAEDGALLVGRAARDRLVVAPSEGRAFFKRDMGTDTRYEFGGKSWTPTELSAAVLLEMKRIAAAHLHEAVDRAVITVPAYFHDPERQATVEAAKIAGLKVERILNEPTAAALAFGYRAGPEPKKVLVFDLGGGSTEFVFGTNDAQGRIEARMSIDVGCVRLTERFLAESDPPAPEDLTAAISYTDTWLDDVVREIPQVSEARTVVGLAGTVSTVAAVEQGLADYDRDAIHHFVLEKEAAEDVFRTLATEARADRVHNPGLEEARADVIVGGCCALVAIFRRLALDEVLCSEADILDGLALSLLPSA